VKVSDLLSKEKMQTAKTAAMDKELQRSKAMAVSLTKELQVSIDCGANNFYFISSASSCGLSTSRFGDADFFGNLPPPQRAQRRVQF